MFVSNKKFSTCVNFSGNIKMKVFISLNATKNIGTNNEKTIITELKTTIITERFRFNPFFISLKT